jgi:hypothetical protein
MSQRSSDTFDINLPVTLNLVVSDLKFSNHDGFKDKQIELAIEEFKEKIVSYLNDRVEREFWSIEFLNSVDFVSFEVKSVK